jgi:hypothetical protein
MTCINCSAEVEGTYCSNCGQRLHVKRLSFKEGLSDFWARIYGFDGMFPRTFKDLTIRPGFAAREFIKGNRARYYGPVGYFFLMITCFLLLLSIMGLDYLEYMKSMQEGLPEQKQSKMSDNIRHIAADNIKLVVFLVIPFQALAARYFFFRKQGLNFLEHSVLPLYMIGHWYWVHMVEAIYFLIAGSTLGVTINGVATGLFMGFGYTSFVTTQPKWKTFLKGLGVYFTGFLMFVTMIVIAMIIMVLIIAVTDPELLKEFKPTKVK